MFAVRREQRHPCRTSSPHISAGRSGWSSGCRELAVERFFDHGDGIEERLLLLASRIEPRCDVTAWDEERVAGADGEAIAEREHGVGRPRDVRGVEVAEGATQVPDDGT